MKQGAKTCDNMESTHSLPTQEASGSINKLTMVNVPMKFTGDYINYLCFESHIPTTVPNNLCE
jgi:hypothetical protein